MSAASAPAPGTLRALLRQPAFVVAAGLAVAITAADYGTDTLASSLPSLSTLVVMLFIIPVIYAALNFGLAGSLWTTGWAMALNLPICIAEHRGLVLATQLVHWVLLAGVSVFIAVQIDRQRQMRDEAARRGEALRASERKYRNLFETNPVATVLLCEGHRVAEANPAACALFDLGSADLRGTLLEELLSPAAAGGADIPPWTRRSPSPWSASGPTAGSRSAPPPRLPPMAASRSSCTT